MDGQGLIALPGIVDMHGDMIEPEIQPRPGVFFPTDLALFELDKRLAASGITTAYTALSLIGDEWPDKADIRSLTVVRDIVTQVNALRESLLIDWYVHARLEISTPSVLPLLRELLTTGQVHLLSLMDHTPGQGQYADIDRYIAELAQARRTHQDDLVTSIYAHIERMRDAVQHWEDAREMALLAHAQGIAVASHDDDTVAKLDLMSHLGVRICEFPISLLMAQQARERGLAVVMGAPNLLRGVSHSGNLGAREAIAAGVVDILASDYYPAALLQAVFWLERHGMLPLHKASRLVSGGPARALGLDDRGALQCGARADMVLVEPLERPRVRATLRNGQFIYGDRVLFQRLGVEH